MSKSVDVRKYAGICIAKLLFCAKIINKEI
jgi:hypothetical protein